MATALGISSTLITVTLTESANGDVLVDYQIIGDHENTVNDLSFSALYYDTLKSQNQDLYTLSQGKVLVPICIFCQNGYFLFF